MPLAEPCKKSDRTHLLARRLAWCAQPHFRCGCEELATLLGETLHEAHEEDRRRMDRYLRRVVHDTRSDPLWKREGGQRRERRKDDAPF